MVLAICCKLNIPPKSFQSCLCQGSIFHVLQKWSIKKWLPSKISMHCLCKLAYPLFIALYLISHHVFQLSSSKHYPIILANDYPKILVMFPNDPSIIFKSILEFILFIPIANRFVVPNPGTILCHPVFQLIWSLWPAAPLLLSLCYYQIVYYQLQIISFLIVCSVFFIVNLI